MAEPKKDEMMEDHAAQDAAADSARDQEAPDPFVELDLLRAERDELRDRMLRALADAENSRKRAERDRREAEHYGGSKLARDLLPVYDNLRRALDAAQEEQRAAAGAVIEGVELTLKELLSVFGKHGMTPVAPEVGDTFDPQLHQAMFEAPVPGTKAGEIIQVMAEGFMLHDRLLRPAQVGVSSRPAS
ncbi:nucleotide exchange factor GrpE [Roseibacterium sp. SDUM158017]|uniref:nucleotide exchange factor GrpE n=1 Tax=Roseicyclus salinarum TaxID=3036773 RepID=UPI0024152F5F|nr:nucleotide exchange factor GrpE [Roseibacterium sp. SDUM158017]MDG4646971.1 nucleotide exchange factor GrpE [Roseibacterium sp. SDUM158017]